MSADSRYLGYEARSPHQMSCRSERCEQQPLDPRWRRGHDEDVVVLPHDDGQLKQGRPTPSGDLAVVGEPDHGSRDLREPVTRCHLDDDLCLLVAHLPPVVDHALVYFGVLAWSQ